MRVIFLALSLFLISGQVAYSADSPPSIKGMQIIYDPDPVGSDYRHSFTFESTSNKPLGKIYYEIAFFDSKDAFIGMSNGFADLSLQYDRCNGTAYLKGIAQTYEITWNMTSGITPEPVAASLANTKVSGFQFVYDDEFVGDQLRHEFTFQVSGAKQLGQRYYEIVFWDENGSFLGYSNGFFDFASGSTRANGSAYLPGVASKYQFCWR